MTLNLIQTKHFILLVFMEIYINEKIEKVTAHQCYVCGPKTHISCDIFDPNNKSFINDCTPSTRGCRITYGNPVERDCEQLDIRDCKTANNIQYCYCSTDLCNGHKINLSDDEDSIENGSGSVMTTNIIENVNKGQASQTSNAQYHYTSPYFLIILVPNLTIKI